MPEMAIPEAYEPLMLPCRYKVMYGGRGSAKSWTVARELLRQGTIDPLRILCGREIMRTIEDSVHRLLSDQVSALGLEDWYKIQNTTITGRNGSEFLFAGLRELDAAKIKSFEGVDVAWIEEAQAVRKKSWTTLIPTIRADGSEIWVTFNPELDSDDTYQRFVAKPPPGAWVKKVSYLDNPWFPSVLEDERKALEKSDIEEYRHVWEGECRTVVAGAVYGREVLKMIEDRRIRPVPYDPALPVHTIWDLGWNDQTSIIFAQRLHSEVRVIKYLEESFKSLPEWVAELNKLPYVWGDDWLPHDGNNTRQQTGKTDAAVLRGLRRRVKIIPRGDIETGIRAARNMFPRAYIDETEAPRLVECLKKYRRAIPTTTNEPGSPVHDEYSHGADAWRGLATIVDQLNNSDRPPPPLVPTFGQAVQGVM